jgi:hypothetical protein
MHSNFNLVAVHDAPKVVMDSGLPCLSGTGADTVQGAAAHNYAEPVLWVPDVVLCQYQATELCCAVAHLYMVLRICWVSSVTLLSGFCSRRWLQTKQGSVCGTMWLMTTAGCQGFTHGRVHNKLQCLQMAMFPNFVGNCVHNIERCRALRNLRHTHLKDAL